jgi:hypothetical protein
VADLGVNIKANDEFEKSALATAAALDAIAKQEEKINALSAKLGVSSQKVGAAQKHIAAQNLADEKKLVAEGQARTKAEEEHSAKLKDGAVAFGVFTAGAVAAVAATYELGKSIAEAAFEADKTRRGTAAMINAFTGGNGPEVMKQLDVYADTLGQSIDETRAKFVEFRRAGVNDEVSANLIKMRADLMAIGFTAAQADKEIQPVLSAGHNTAMANYALKAISVHYGNIGDGAKAAAYAISSVEGAQNKIKNAGTEALADMWEEIGPSVGKAANELADFGVELLKSDEGKEAIHGIEAAFKALPGAVKGAIDGIKTAYNFIVDNKASVVAALGVIGVALAVTFGPAVVAAGLAAAAFLAVPLAVTAAAVAIGAGVKAISDNWDTLKDATFGDFVSWGASLVDGLVEGLKGAAGKALDAVTGLAKDVAGGFASALGIHSPSTVFAGYGANTVEGYNKGQEAAISADPPPLQAAAGAAPASSMQPPAIMRQQDSSGGGGGGVNVTIQHLSVQGGGSAEDNARAIRQEFQLLFQAMQLSQGGA